MEFLPGLISKLDPTTNSGFFLTLILFGLLIVSSIPKIRIKLLEVKEKIEESETAKESRKFAAMESELEYFRANFEDLREETRQLHDYAQYTMRAMRRLERFLTSQGIDFPPPPFEDYDTWAKRTLIEDENL